MQPAPLLRARNPLAAQLASSICVFRIHAAPGVAEETLAPAPLRRVCDAIGGRLEVSTARDGGAVLTFCVSHAVLDAFGGMYLLARYAALPAPRSDGAYGVERAGAAGDFEYVHFARACESPPDDSRTVTQRAVGAIVAALGDDVGSRVALVVAKDDPVAIGEETFLGNSLVSIELPSSELAALAAGDKRRWRDEVQSLSDRVRAVALRRAELLRPPSARVTVSSVGDVARIPWAAALDPSVFEMVPTPATPEGATIVLWGRGPHQALTICARPTHPAARAAIRLRDAWANALP